jgi:hypothetical protein
MTSGVSRVFGGAVLVAAVGWATAFGASGCSSSSGAGASQDAASFACPATFEATIGQACGAEGAVCSPTFPCAIATVTVDCTCTGGTFQCIDGQGNPYAPGETPTCPTSDGGLPACPQSETLAGVAKCSEEQSGQQCAYKPECDSGTVAYDLCICEPNTGGTGFHFTCNNSCSGNGPVPESGPSSGGTDAAGGTDAPVNDASGAEAASSGD